MVLRQNHRAHRASYRDETIVTDKGDCRYGEFAIKNFLLTNPLQTHRLSSISGAYLRTARNYRAVH